jgi:hypothetical protein
MSSSESMDVFIILSILIICGCFVLSCCGYILSQRKYRTRHQMQFINHSYAPEAQEQVFAIEIPYTQPSDNEPSSLDLTKKSSPSYATMEVSVPGK